MGFLGIEAISTDYVTQCELHGWPYRFFAATPGKPWRTWPAIYRWLMEEQPEAVLLHSVTAILPCWWYKSKTGAKIIAVEHQPNALKKRSEWWVSRLLPRLADAIVCLTPGYRLELERALGGAFRKEKVTVIPNGIDVSKFAPRDNRQPDEIEDTVRLGMAARFSNKKRQDCLVEMMRYLQTDGHDHREYRLSLAGDGTELERVKHLASELGVADRVDFPGYLGESDLIEWYRGLDIYLHASDGETLSTSLLQAMAMRLPIVASDVDGISNLLGQGDAGTFGLLSKNSPRRFAEQVVRLASSRQERIAVAEAAYKAAHHNYSNEAMFRSYDALIKRLITS